MKAKVKVMKRSLLIRSSLVVLIILLLLLNVPLVCGYDLSQSRTNWMGLLSDDLLISQLSIPGTHDTMTYGYEYADFMPWVKCQDANLRNQLDAGIRVLDIRCRHVNNEFKIHHGKYDVNADFDDVLSDCTEFLAAHPNETIIMRVDRECSDDPGSFDCEDEDNTRSFYDTFLWYRYSYSSYIWQPANTPPQVPRLGEVRGKIVILKNFPGQSDYILDYSGTVKSQDYYDFGWDPFSESAMVPEAAIPFKWNEVVKWHNGVNQRAEGYGHPLPQPEPNTLYMNYLSGTGFYTTPSSLAWYGKTGDFIGSDGINGKYFRYLLYNNFKYLGIVMMDFPREGLIDIIIAHNFRYVCDNGELSNFLDTSTMIDTIGRSTPGNDCCERVGTLRDFLKLHIYSYCDLYRPGYPGYRDWYWIVINFKGATAAWICGGEDIVRDFVQGDSHYHVYNLPSDCILQDKLPTDCPLSTNVNVDEMRSNVDTQVSSLSGDCMQRERDLKSYLDSAYPHTMWTVVVLKEPANCDNFAYYPQLDCSYDKSRDGYRYVVWGYGSKNLPPVAEAGGPYESTEGVGINFDARASSDPEGDSLQYRWDFDKDGTWDTDWSNQPTANHTYVDEWNGEVVLEVRDDGNPRLVDSDSALVTIYNVAPIVTATAGDTINETGVAKVTGTITDPGIHEKFEVVIDWGDGEQQSYTWPYPGIPSTTYPTGTAPYSVDHCYGDDNPTGTSSDVYEISVTVTDGDGGADTANTTVTVNNVAPVVSAHSWGLIDTVDEAKDHKVVGTFTDPGYRDTFTVRIDWGDGTQETYTYPASPVPTSYSETHQYLDDNPTGTSSDDYEISVTVTDDDGGEGTATTIVTVNNVAPAVTATGDTVDETCEATVNGTITDPGTQDTFTVEIDWGEGTPETYTYPAGTKSYRKAHLYRDDNPTGTSSDEYDISVTVTDDDGGEGTASTTVTVNNVAPAVTAIGDTVDENGTATVNGTITDPGTQDTFTVEIDWGEGTPETYNYSPSPFNVSINYSETHQYRDDNPAGTLSDDYDIIVTVTDDDGGVGTATTTVTVNNVAPVTNIDSITDENGAEIGIEVPVTLIGLIVNVAGSFTDVGTLDTHTASMDWDDGTSDDLGVVSGTTDASHIYTDPGDYTMTLAVTDDDTGVDMATALITVVDDEGATATAIQELTPLADDPNIAAALNKLNGALEKLEEGKLEEDKLIAGLGMIKQALQYLEAAEAANPNLDLTDIKGLLALTAKSVAVRAIEQAETLATKPNELQKIEQAKVLVAEGDALRTAADYAGAVEKYQQAVRELPGIKLPE